MDIAKLLINVELFQSTRQWLIPTITPRHWPIQGHWPVDLPIRQWSRECFASHQLKPFTNAGFESLYLHN
jgi:hypothetical protein